MSIKFCHSEPLTIGVELELQLLDRVTMELSSSSIEVLAQLNGDPSFKAEIYQSMIEVITGICQDSHEIGLQLRRSLNRLNGTCDKLGLKLASAGTHPTAQYSEAHLFPHSRYRILIKNHRWLAKRLLIFGLHVHIGMRNQEYAVSVTNGLLYYLPLFLALSSSSPYSGGVDTQLASSRSTFFESLPTGGYPCTFESWEEFQLLYEKLVGSKSIGSPKDLWWDIRPSPGFGTIEVRICDSPSTIKETEAIVALIHLLAIKKDQEISCGVKITPPEFWYIRENKWRAVRLGVQAEFLVNADGKTESVKNFLNDLIIELAPLIEIYNYNEQMEVLKQIVEYGTSSDRQRKIFTESNNHFFSILKQLTRELATDEPEWESKEKKMNKKPGGTQCA